MTQDLKKTGDLNISSQHNDKDIVFDARWMTNGRKKPVILFVHGFKGFKDWGAFNAAADEYAAHGFVFVKMNLSHNGTSAEHPTDFMDLEAFGNNNFSIELDDIGDLIDHLFGTDSPLPREADKERLYLLGHSRGGGLVILKAHEDPRVKALVTLAAIADLADRWSTHTLEQWKKRGKIDVPNSRTGQMMHMNYQIVEDYDANRARLDIPKATAALEIPWLAFHGTNDETLPVQMANDMKRLNPKIDLRILEGASHTFGAAHPWKSDKLEGDFRTVVQESIAFLKKLD